MDKPAYHCPNCGAALNLVFRYSKLINCKHCNNDLILADDILKARGKSAVMADYPSLLQLGIPFEYNKPSHLPRGKGGKQSYLPIGRVRYQYDHGYWDEWWTLDQVGSGFWISVDEGDMAIEKAIQLDQIILFPELELGSHIEINKTNWLVTERDSARCIGLEGELPELIQVGDKMSYVHLSANPKRLLTLEMDARGLSAYEGYWLDPFEFIETGQGNK